MNRLLLDVAITVKSPFLFPDVGAGAFGLDRIALRNGQNTPIIPQGQVRGILLHACADAARAMQKKQTLRFDIFGRVSAEARPEAGDTPVPREAFAPKRGRILFSDLVMQGRHAEAMSSRVSIDPDLGAADEGKLMFVELVAPPGQDVVFSGTAVLHASDAEAKEWLPLLSAAASWVSAVGAMKSAGFGEVVAFSVKERARTPLAPAKAVSRSGRQGYVLRFDRPFLLDARRAADNVYVGQPVVPGAVIKGALAHKAALRGAAKRLEAALSVLAISHARVEGAGPQVPLSMVIAHDGSAVGDALLVPMGQGAVIHDQPARWSADWKPADEARVRSALGLVAAPSLGRSVRTHVSIDPETGSALRGKLFVTDAVDPGNRAWHFTVDYDRIADKDARAELAALLEGGLDGLGRTEASASLEPCAAPALPAVVPVHGFPDHFAVVLESDAVMAGPDDDSDSFSAYARWWARVLPGATLVSFSARQRLAGGYLARRYGDGDVYSPFCLTEGGSVFLLKGNLAAPLAQLTARNLPSPLIDGRPSTWQTCPFQPENGYGAIRCDHDARLQSGVTHG